MKETLPKWHLELDRFKAFKTVFILEGNVFDLHSYRVEKHSEDGIENSWELCKLDYYLHRYLTGTGYTSIVFYNHIDGFTNEFDAPHLERFLAAAEGKASGQQQQPSQSRQPSSQEAAGTDQAHHDRQGSRTNEVPIIDRATKMIRTALGVRESGAKAVVLNLASRYISSPANLEKDERFFYSRLFLTTHRPVQCAADQGFLNNLLFIVVNKANDVPAWFYLDNPYAKIINVTKPDKHTRERFIGSQLRFFPGVDQIAEPELGKHKDKFVDLTDGFTNIELNGLRSLCKQENISIQRIAEAISLYKYGIKENPWKEISEKKLDTAKAFIKERVKGQEAAIVQTLDIVKRAAMGLSGLQHSATSSKPRGILFFAGPTGTGKTELAKTVAHLLFGDDSACIRFDMSEYQQSHSDQKLLGAPPGYVGYEAGGQLTNAIKERPFSILLFDEIEKAHPSIFDKFLQILEDGRMTDGQGDTVYFSESVIIFTSNLGIYSKDEYGNRVANVTQEMREEHGYEWLQKKIISSIKDYFVLELGRPEILNRIGNNFVVFDYISESVARQIMESQLRKICDAIQETKGITLSVQDEALNYLAALAFSNLENGGRGIGNIIEKYFINPLSRYIFDHKVDSGSTMIISSISEHDNVAELACQISN